MGLTAQKMTNLVVLLVIGMAFFGIIVSVVSQYTEKDPATGAPTVDGMTNSTAMLLDLVPFLVIIGLVIAAVMLALGGAGKGK